MIVHSFVYYTYVIVHSFVYYIQMYVVACACNPAARKSELVSSLVHCVHWFTGMIVHFIGGKQHCMELKTLGHCGFFCSENSRVRSCNHNILLVLCITKSLYIITIDCHPLQFQYTLSLDNENSS